MKKSKKLWLWISLGVAAVGTSAFIFREKIFGNGEPGAALPEEKKKVLTQETINQYIPSSMPPLSQSIPTGTTALSKAIPKELPLQIKAPTLVAKIIKKIQTSEVIPKNGRERVTIQKEGLTREQVKALKKKIMLERKKAKYKGT